MLDVCTVDEYIGYVVVVDDDVDVLFAQDCLLQVDVCVSVC